MPFYTKLGSIPPKRHTIHHREGGHHGEGIYYEEVVTTAGFGRAYQHRLSSAAADARAARSRRPARCRSESCHNRRCGIIISRPAHARGGDPIMGRVPLLTTTT